uniref:Uncharacterized protein n=1 Tax=Quercus lobata TaxID=97700 RepID=A0A7N2LE65_QUELO
MVSITFFHELVMLQDLSIVYDALGFISSCKWDGGCKCTDQLQCLQAEEFSSRIQKIASQGSAADRELMGPKFWKS